MKRDWNRLKRWIIRKKLQGWHVTKICAYAQVSRRMFYRWWNRYQKEGWIGLAEKPKGRPKSTSMDDKLKRTVIRLRKRYKWGPNKIEGFLKHREISIPHNRIYQIICEDGLNNPIGKPRKTWGKKRFERLHSNSLWQTDFKLLDNDNWICSYLDDHSRFVTNGKEFSENPCTEIALSVFMKAGGKHGFPKQVLTDQGTEFYCAPKEDREQGISTFTKTLTEMGIQHIVASKRRPTTIGKIEAFHKGVEYESPVLEMNFKKYVKYWNETRPHQELNYLTPAVVYFRDGV